MSSWLRLAEIALVSALAAIIFVSWGDDRRDRTQLSAQLATAQQSLAAAESRQHDRDAQLQQTLATINAQKSATLSPAEVVAQLQKQFPLPVPLTLQRTKGNPPQAHASGSVVHDPREPTGTDSAGNSLPQGSSLRPDNPIAPPDGKSLPAALRANQVVLPTQDLKPLYNFALDCKACQAKLAAAQGDLADEKTKTATLTHERDAALKASNGGSLLRRVARAAKWFAIGAAAGALAAKAAH